VTSVIEGTCLCGAVRWTLRDTPQSATACSCTACRRYGALWAYGWEDEDVTLSGETVAFIRGDSLSFDFCATCGNVGHWRGLEVNEQGRRRVAVNLRLAEPGSIENVPIRHFDGLDTWKSRPDDGKCVKDMWF